MTELTKKEVKAVAKYADDVIDFCKIASDAFGVELTLEQATALLKKHGLEEL